MVFLMQPHVEPLPIGGASGRCSDAAGQPMERFFVVDYPHSLARLLIIMGRTIYEREPSAETELLKV